MAELKPKKFIERAFEVQSIEDVKKQGRNDREISKMILIDHESGIKVTFEKPGFEQFKFPIGQSILIVAADSQMKLTDVD